MNYLEKMNTILNKILMICGGMFVLSLMALATANVILRTFYIPYQGTYEIVSFLGAMAIAFPLGYTQKKRDHMLVDILTQKLSDRTNRILDGISYFITTIFFAIVSWRLFFGGMRTWKSGEVSGTLKIIFYPFMLSVSIGFGVLTLTLIVDFLRNLRKERG